MAHVAIGERDEVDRTIPADRLEAVLAIYDVEVVEVATRGAEQEDAGSVLLARRLHTRSREQESCPRSCRAAGPLFVVGSSARAPARTERKRYVAAQGPRVAR